MQKLLFLLSEEFQLPAYDFIPYKFGCFSIQSYADKRNMIRDGFLLSNEHEWRLANEALLTRFHLVSEDKCKIDLLHSRYSSLKGDELIRHVYLKYPYYATKSEIVGKILSPSQTTEIEKARPTNQRTVLYTIGYEGKSLEKYINRLITEDVKVLCDVRRNPLSMKYGFSKTTLKRAVESVGIEYVHIPELGIESEKRKNLQTRQDFDTLFSEYEINLNEKKAYIHQIETMLSEKKRVALTCFEAAPNSCHRTIIAKNLRINPSFAFEYKEL
jgi:uncharacterized protein (DUF488 family)